MTLGEKIKKYRIIKQLTQKELGLKSGFLPSSSDSRTRKYESDLVVPKPEVKNSIANALDVDLEALSDINITSHEDIIHIFFELEETLSMKVEHFKDKTYIVFDDNNQKNSTLISYLNIWRKKQKSISDRNEYMLWKASFLKKEIKNLNEYCENILNKINESACISLSDNNSKLLTSMLGIAELLKKMRESGIYVSVIEKDFDTKKAYGIMFDTKDVLSSNSVFVNLFSTFLYNYNHWNREYECFTEFLTTDKLYIIYHIVNPDFYVVKYILNEQH